MGVQPSVTTTQTSRGRRGGIEALLTFLTLRLPDACDILPSVDFMTIQLAA